MKSFHQFIIVLITLFSIGCTNSKIEDLNWLEGTWQSGLADGKQLEKWSLNNDSLVGKRYLITRADTTLMQEMRIYKGESALEMRVTPLQAPYNSLFECQKVHKNQLVFKNVQQSFPELLEYALVRDTLAIYARGKTQGMMNEAVFAFTRVELH